jgi:hypothetical protein
MTTSTKTRTKKKTKKESTIHWAEDWGTYKEHPTKYTVRQLNNRLDFTGLEIKLKRCLHTDVVITGQMEKGHNGGMNIDFRSQNLADQAGVLSPIFKELYVNEFSNGVYEHENGDIVLSLSVHYRWEFHDGGSNGHQLFWAYYNFDRKEWAFTSKG